MNEEAIGGGARRRIETLDQPECMILLATTPLGRLGFCAQGSPRIEVVNFVVDADAVYIRMALGAKSAAVGRGGPFALEADRIDEVNGTGWDVTVVGPVSWVDEPAEVERAMRLLHPWAPGPRPHVAKIVPQLVFGRRVTTA